MLRPPFLPFLLSLVFALSAASAVNSADWVHWRGPAQNGHSLEKDLPADFDLKTKENVLWVAPYGGRSAPLVMGGRVYVLQGFGEGLNEGERVVCLDEKSGKKLWEHVEHVFHSDVVSSRLGWTPLAGDPESGRVYANTTAGDVICLDKDGKVIWARQLTEEFGRFTGYGGRVPAPIFDSGLLIIGSVTSSWGDQARGGVRYYAFDGKNGNVVWISETGLPPKSTYQSNPVIAVINGQRLMITGAGDGALHAFKVRTGEKVWTYPFSAGAVNPSPVVDGNLVYCAHGEENLDTGKIGRVICVDASQIDPQTKKPKLVWEYNQSRRFGLSSPALADGVLLVPEDTGELYAFNAKTGKVLWKYRYGTEVRGAPLLADGKAYIFDVKGHFSIIPLGKDPKKAPDPLDVFVYTFRETINGRPVQTETNGTPVAVNGRVYFTSRAELICLGNKGAKPSQVKYKPMPPEAEYKPNAVAGARLYPAEVTAHAGETVKLQVVYVDANGREVKPAGDQKAEWAIVTPAKTPTGAQPPALAAKLTGDAKEGNVALAPNPSQQGYVSFKAGDATARARIRVAPKLPYANDFDKAPDGSSPAGWINTNGKYVVKKLPDGNNVLSKVNNNARPPVARANAYVTEPAAADYTVQADIMGTLVRGKLPDAGLVNSNYTLVLDGKPDPVLGKRTVRLTSWEARPRINEPAAFDWEPNTWYTAKFVVEPKGKGAVVRGKVWKKGDAEPDKWTISVEDPFPTVHGAGGLYGYVPNVLDNAPGSELYFDNLRITPNAKK
jgi:outer membrane protein assembly factor BamB